MISGKMTKPGEMVENFGKNWRILIAKKKQFATLLNCSNKFLGTNVKIVYLDVTFWLVAK